jgi:hypothetical protein
MLASLKVSFSAECTPPHDFNDETQVATALAALRIELGGFST